MMSAVEGALFSFIQNGFPILLNAFFLFSYAPNFQTFSNARIYWRSEQKKKVVSSFWDPV